VEFGRVLTLPLTNLAAKPRHPLTVYAWPLSFSDQIMADDNRIKLTVSLEGPADLIERAAEILHALMIAGRPAVEHKPPPATIDEVLRRTPAAVSISPRRRTNGSHH
jgi:hypothetical protein